MNYIIIQSLPGQSASVRANDFTKELFKISRPVPDQRDVTTDLFGLIQHPTSGEWAMQVDDEALITEAEVAELKDKEYMDANGWFPAVPEEPIQEAEVIQ